MEDQSKLLKMKEWDELDRPREKLLHKGKQSLSDAELLAILLGSGNKDENVVDLAKRVLSENKNNLVELSKNSINDLMKYKGIGEAKAITIVAALELGYRRLQTKVKNAQTIISPKDIYNYMSVYFNDAKYEEFWILLLNFANKIITQKKISEGSTNKTVFDIKKIFTYVIEYNASSIVLCHNHPSDNLEPSIDDINITEQIKNGCQIFNCHLSDHLIFGNNNYYSFFNNGLIKEK